MKKILLLGDSIRKGYDRYIKESMADIAEVYYPTENCMFTSYILRRAHEWKSDLKLDSVDVVHWNVGHWDTLRIYNDEPLTKPEVYADNLERIYKRLKFLFPNAVQIFATSTPVIENGFVKGFAERLNADVEKYNDIAKSVLTKHNVLINDLYDLLKDKPDFLHSDQTHYYTAEATELIGDKVNKMICDALQLDEKDLIKPDKEDFVITSIKSDSELYVKKGDYYEPVQGI